MTGEPVPVSLLEAGDMIHVSHRHEPGCGRCLTRYATDAVVVGEPRRVGGRVVVHWREDPRLLGGTPAITGAIAFGPGERVIRIGHLEVRRAA
jgi:hypothetical protein